MAPGLEKHKNEMVLLRGLSLQVSVNAENSIYPLVIFTQDHKNYIRSRVLKDGRCSEPLQHLKLTLQSMKTLYWPSWVLLQKIANLYYAPTQQQILLVALNQSVGYI